MDKEHSASSPGNIPARPRSHPRAGHPRVHEPEGFRRDAFVVWWGVVVRYEGRKLLGQVTTLLRETCVEAVTCLPKVTSPGMPSASTCLFLFGLCRMMI
jgi:hypothetical protein